MGFPATRWSPTTAVASRQMQATARALARGAGAFSEPYHPTRTIPANRQFSRGYSGPVGDFGGDYAPSKGSQSPAAARRAANHAAAARHLAMKLPAALAPRLVAAAVPGLALPILFSHLLGYVSEWLAYLLNGGSSWAAAGWEKSACLYDADPPLRQKNGASSLLPLFCIGNQALEVVPLETPIAAGTVSFYQVLHTHNAADGSPRYQIHARWSRPADVTVYEPVAEMLPRYVPYIAQPIVYSPPQINQDLAPATTAPRVAAPPRLGGGRGGRYTSTPFDFQLSVDPRGRVSVARWIRPAGTPPRVKEVKSKASSWRPIVKMHAILNMATEGVDFLEVLAKATGYRGKTDLYRTRDMMQHVMQNIDEFDPDLFLEEFYMNWVEDFYVGRAQGAKTKALGNLKAFGGSAFSSGGYQSPSIPDSYDNPVQDWWTS